MSRMVGILVVAAVVAGGTAVAGPLDVRAVGGTVTEGNNVTVTVYLDVSTTGIQGWQYGLCHDTARLTYFSNTMGAGTAASQAGGLPDYSDLDLYPGGLTWVVLIDFNLVSVLPVGPGFEDLKVTYTAGMLGPGDPDPTVTPVSPCDKAFGSPPVAATYTIGGTSFASTLIPGTVTIKKTPPPPSIFDVRVENETVDEGQNVAVSIFIDTNVSGVQGWQYGICHNAYLTHFSHALGASTQALNGGFGPDFMDFDIHAGGETWVVLVDDASVNTLPPGNGLEDVVVTYKAALLGPGDPDPTVVQVAPCDKVLGIPPVAAAYTVGGTSYPAGLIPGSVSIKKTPVPPPYFDVRVESETVDEGQNVAVSIFIDTNVSGVQGWQYGICHNAYLTHFSHALGASTQALNGGFGPDFMDFDIHAGGETWVVLVDDASINTLPPGDGLEDVVVTYKAALLGPGDPDPTVVQVSPCDKVLGSPPVAAAYTVGGTSYPAGLIPGTVSIKKKPLPPPYFNVRAEDDTVQEGQNVALSIYIDTNVTGVQGWQYGICHGAGITHVSHALGASTQALNGGAGPDFTDFDVYAGGETWVVLVDDASVNTLPPGDGLEDVVVTYKAALLDPCGPGTVVVDVDPCDKALGSPLVAAAYTVGGTSYPAGLIQGQVTITKAPLVPMFKVEAEDETVDEGDTVEVSFTIDTNIPNVEGWQYGICHAADLTYVSHALGASTQALNSGAGPDFVDFDVYAGGETWAVLIDTNSVGDRFLAPGNDLEDLAVTYEARLLNPADPDPVTVAIALCDKVLGSPPVAAVYSTCATSHPATLEDGSVKIEKAPVPFIRGDGNTDKVVDLADAVWILNYLFRSGPSGTCMLALNANGDLAVDLGDPIYLLNYLFTNGPEPPAPFPTCGTIPGQVLSQCMAYTCP